MKSHTQMSQRDKMRELYGLYRGDEVRVIEAYAECEQRGEVDRKRDSRSQSSHHYAAKLYADGKCKRWIYE